MNDQAMKNPDQREDEELQSMMRDRMIGASQQATFHRCEAEKWERIARSTAAAVVALEDTRPVASVDPDELYNDARKRAADETTVSPNFSTGQSAPSEGAVLRN